MKKRSVCTSVLCIILAVLMLTVCACNTGSQTGQEDKTTETKETSGVKISALVAKKDAKKGSVLTVKDVEVIEVDQASTGDDYLTMPTQVVSKPLLVDIKAGDVICASMLGKSDYKPSGNISVSIARKLGYLVVTDYFKPDTGEDLAYKIQNLIDSNPRRTIFFPDGVYTITKPIKTSSNPKKAVSLHLSGNAVIKASDKWRGGAEYMIQLGAIEETFTTYATGSNYYMYGGVIDGNAKAKALALEGGRETSVRQISIKNAVDGLFIAYNAVYTSNDCDFESIEIEGCGFAGSVGVLVSGMDNTLTDIRITGFETAMQLTAPGNLMHNVYAVYKPSEYIDYSKSIGFSDTCGSNWMDGFTSEGYHTAFKIAGGGLDMIHDCTAIWNNQYGDSAVAIDADGKFSSIVNNLRADFVDGMSNVFLKLGRTGGRGVIKYPIFDTSKTADETYKTHLYGKVIWSK